MEHFYTLSPMSDGSSLSQDAIPASAAQGTIGIGPVRLPEAIDRPQMVIRISPNRLDVSEHHRWAGALDREIARVVAENLAFLLGTVPVVVFPWAAADTPSLRVALDIQRFDGKPGMEARLSVTWTISQAGAALHRQQSRLRQPVLQECHEALVAAQSRLLEDLSRQIAAVISGLGPSPATRRP
jgi:uncharacterized lipoprotein YmbA